MAIRCSSCDVVIPPGDKFCWNCGALVNSQSSGPQREPHQQTSAYLQPPVYTSKDKLAAGLLALFLGGIGIHKFYLGKPGQGIFYLLFCWTFIPMIISFVEGLVYLSMSKDAFARAYPG